MIDEVSGVGRFMPKKQVSMEIISPLHEIEISTAVSEIQQMRHDLEYGLVLMNEIQSKLEQAYQSLSK